MGAASRLRWIFLPLGLCALVAVGAHAAADVVGDRVLGLVDSVDALFDSLFSKWSLTAPLVDLVGLEQRTLFARGVALVWELCADALLALPLLGYDERTAAEEAALARVLLRTAAKRPTPLLVRPLAALLVGMAGAGAVARMVQGSLQLALHSGALARIGGAAVLLALLVFFVPRAALRTLERADTLSAEKGRTAARAATLGLAGALLLLPLALAALSASRLYAFFL
jgi:hypothetical protein